MTLASVLLTVVVSVAGYAPQQAGSAPLPAAQEARVQALGKLLRCAVCQGVSIADSPASMARAQLDKVRSLVAEGKSDDEIRAYFVARYGEWALLSPPRHGLNWVVWLGPAALLAVGLALIALRLRRPGTPTSPKVPAAPAGAADPYLAAIREEVRR